MYTQSKLLEVIEITRAITKHGLDLGGIMNLVVHKILPLVNADGAVIELTEGDSMVYRAVSGIADSFLGLSIPIQGSLSGLSVQTGQILRSDDSISDPRVNRQITEKIGLRSMIVMPLKFNEVVVGVFKAMSETPNKFTNEEEILLELLSGVLSAILFYSSRLNLDELIHRATHDGLTNLANRSLFMERLRIALNSKQANNELSVLMIDMDGLKKLNDEYGHKVGDAAIVELGNRISNTCRRSDTVARLGGDEFAVLLNPINSSKFLEELIQNMKKEIEKSFYFDGNNFTLSASIGAAIYPQEASNLEKLLDLADKKMYTIKKERYKKLAR